MKTNTNKKPIVQFDYPDSKTGHMRYRIVEVDELTKEYIQGYERNNGKGKIGAVPQYKRYRLNRIAFDGIVLIGYE